MNNTIDNKTLKQVLKRSWTVGAAYNNLRGQAHGAIYSLYPVFDKLYPNPEDHDKKVEAIKRHEVFYNITPQVNTVGLGLFTVLEEKIAEDENFDKTAVNAIKIAIQGPASGVGDAMFQVTIKLIAASIGLSFAQNGSPIGGFLFFAIFNLCSFFSRKYLLKFSYGAGEKIIAAASESGILKMITGAASIIGLFMVGAMVANSVNLTLALSWEAAGGTISVQSFFDSIMPKFLPLMATLSVTYFVRKKVSANLIMILIIIGSVLGKAIGLF